MKRTFIAFVFATLFVATPTYSFAQEFRDEYYGKWFTGTSFLGGNDLYVKIVYSSRVIRDDSVYVYQFRITNEGTYPVIIHWGLLDKLLSGGFCGTYFVPLAPGEAKEFSFSTHLEPVFYDDDWLDILHWKDMTSDERDNNSMLAGEKLGKLTYPKQGEILKSVMAGGTSGVIPIEFSTCFKDMR